MRRFSAFATVSTFALGLVISLAGSHADAADKTADKIVRFGSVLSQSEWTVGTVKGKRDTYCATVNSFKGGNVSGDIVLAVARDPAGYGSLAFDFPQKIFKAGSDYEATMTPGGGKARILRGRATTEKSIIVQVGTDEAFFQSMANGTLLMSTPVMEGTFGLGKFTDAYQKLVGCAAELAMPKVAKVAVEDVERATITPLDQAAAAVDKKETSVQLADAKAPVKANALDDMEAQLDHDAKAEEARAKEAAAKADAEQKDIAARMEESKKDVIRLQTQKQVVERKLLMSSSDGATKSVVSTAGLSPSAMELEKKQVEAFKARAQENAAAAKETAAASTAVAVAKEASDKKVNIVLGKVDADAKIEKALARKDAKAEEKAAVEKASVEKAGAPETAPKPADIVWNEPPADAVKDVAAAAKAPASAPASPSVSAPVSTPVAMAAADKAATAEKEATAALESKLSASEKARADANARLAELEDKNKQAEAALKEKQAKAEAALKSEPTQKKLKAEKENLEAQLDEMKRKNSDAVAAMKREMDARDKQYESLKAELEEQKKLAKAADDKESTAVAELQKQLAQKDAQNEALKKELDTAKTDVKKAAEPDPAMLEKYNKLNDDLAQKQKAMADLEARMKDLEKTRAEEAARAKTAQAELDSMRAELAKVKQAAIDKAADARIESDTAALEMAMAMNRPATPAAAIDKTAAPADAPKPVVPQQPTVVTKTPVPAVSMPVAAPDAAAPGLDVSAPVPAAVSPENKAEAFLDTIMAAHHIKSTKPAIAPEETAKQAAIEAAAAKTDIAVKPAAAELTDRLPDAAENTVPAAKTAKAEKPSFFGRVKNIFASDDKAAAAGAKTNDASDYPNASGIPAFPGGGITLEKLLGYSGTARVNFVSVSSRPGEVVRQWTSDNIDGLYEQFPAASSMETQVKTYIDRYRQDCPNSLTTSMREPKAIAAGMMVEGDMVCTAPGNSYATSFIFLENQGVFHALLHTGYNEDISALRRIADNLALTLSRASQFLAPQPAMKKPLRRPLPLDNQAPGQQGRADDLIEEDNVVVAPPAAIAPPETLPAPAVNKPAFKASLPSGKADPSANVSSDAFGTVVIE